MESIHAWLLEADADMFIEPLHGLDVVLRQLMSATTDLEGLWKELALRTKTPYVRRALLAPK